MGADEYGEEALAWKELMRTHPSVSDLDDAMLRAAAEFEKENPPKVDLTRPTWGEVRQIEPKTGPTIEFVDDVSPMTEMQFVRMRADDDSVVEGFVPLELPETGLKVLVDGKPALLYLHPGDNLVHMEEVDEHEADDDEQQQLMAMSKIEVKIVGYNPLAERQLYGVSLSDEFVAYLLEAWEHVDHGCTAQQIAETYLSRFVEQFIGGLQIGDARKDGL